MENVTQMTAEKDIKNTENAENAKDIIFVCTGNTCRSPMAEFYFNFAIKNSKLHNKISASSCGFSVMDGRAMSKFSYEVMSENSILENYNGSLFKSRQIDELIIKNSFLVYGITKKHTKYISAMFPQYKYFDGSTQLKIRHMPIEIDDPYAGNIETYRSCFEKIRKSVDMIIEELELEFESGKREI